MKKILFLIIFVQMSIVATSTSGNNYFNIGQNDTLLVSPAAINSYLNIPVKAHIEGLLDEWILVFSYPTGMEGRSVMPGPGMSRPYMDYNGEQQTYVAPLSANYNCTQVSSVIRIFGYQDYNNDSIYEPYGTVKWEAGDYEDMFEISATFDAAFSCGTIGISGTLKSLPDYRQNVIAPNPYTFTRTITVIVGYQRGDVDGSGSLTITDVTMLMNYLVSQSGFNQYQLAAADVNRDGIVNISDVTALIYILNQMNGTNGLSLDDFDI